LFSHPGDFTPVCTTELGEVARRADDFAKRNTKVIGISANGLQSHHKWVEDINEYGGKTVGPTDVKFPIVRACVIYRSRIIHSRICRSPMKTGKFLPSMTCWTNRMLPIVMRRVSLSPYVVLISADIDSQHFCCQIRTVFIIDPRKVIRLTVSYPASTGRNFDEVIRSVYVFVAWLTFNSQGWFTGSLTVRHPACFLHDIY